tara:strand:+ start:286 stop:1299 length:1014 start_codon:yes stop_codon:yes gene_type:complete
MQDLKVRKDFAVAVSGGPDSLALVLLSENYAKENGLKLTALSVDHSLRPDSKDEIKWIKKLMRRNKIKFSCIKLKGKKPDSNIMAYARERRYSLLTQYCKRSKISYLLTAHHLDDEIENFLMRLIRGSGIKGLSSSHTSFKHRKSGVNIVRPLLSFSKKSLIKYLSLTKQNYVVDPTNKDVRFDRSRIRVLTAKLISEGLSKSRFSNVIDNLKKAESAIEKSLSGYGKNLIQIRDKSSLAISIKNFIKIPEEIQFRLFVKIVEYVSKKKQKPRAKSISNLMKKIIRRDFKSMTVHGCIFTKEGKEIIIKLEYGRANKTKKKHQFVSFTKKGISDLFI